MILLYCENVSHFTKNSTDRWTTIKRKCNRYCHHRWWVCVEISIPPMNFLISEEYVIQAKVFPNKYHSNLLIAHFPAKASPIQEWYDTSAGVRGREMYAKGRSLKLCLFSSKMHGPPVSSSCSALIDFSQFGSTWSKNPAIPYLL